jgi:hypothetical protein
LPHSNPTFLNSISILSSNCHLHLLFWNLWTILYMNFSFCLHANMSYISYHPWFNYLRISVRHRQTSVEITIPFSFHLFNIPGIHQSGHRTCHWITRSKKGIWSVQNIQSMSTYIMHLHKNLKNIPRVLT